mgnify:CR=1 FL=1
MTLLAAQGIARHFGGVRAVDGVDLELKQGEFAALIGPNGAGKSTLFAVIAGQQRADAGRVLFDGGDITRASPVRRARLGIGRTFQTAAAFASMTVLQNVQLALAARAGQQVDPWRPLSRMHRDAAGALHAKPDDADDGAVDVAPAGAAGCRALRITGMPCLAKTSINCRHNVGWRSCSSRDK